MDAVCINMNGTEMAAAMGGHVVTYLSPFCGKYLICVRYDCALA
jgi:hypothetical protein